MRMFKDLASYDEINFFSVILQTVSDKLECLYKHV